MFPCFVDDIFNCDFEPWVQGRIRQQFYKFSDDLTANKEISYSKTTQLAQFADSKILVIGAGPSTNEVEWDPCNYDHLWSINHFFMHKKLYNLKMSLVSLCPEIDLRDPVFELYYKKFEPLVGFEVRARWDGTDWMDSSRLDLNERFSADKKTFAFHTRYGGKVGGCARLILLAAHLGAREIDFVGMDGIPSIYDNTHAFEKGKVSLPGGVNAGNAHAVCKAHYDTFWTYFLAQFPNLPVHSLQKGNQFHDPYVR